MAFTVVSEDLFVRRVLPGTSVVMGQVLQLSVVLGFIVQVVKIPVRSALPAISVKLVHKPPKHVLVAILALNNPHRAQFVKKVIIVFKILRLRQFAPMVPTQPEDNQHVSSAQKATIAKLAHLLPQCVP